MESVNLSKIIEERLLKNSRTVSTIGKPISFKIDLNDSFNSLGENLVKVCKQKKIKLLWFVLNSFCFYFIEKVKLIANGRLNDGELVLNGIRENLSERFFLFNWFLKWLKIKKFNFKLENKQQWI